MKNYKLLSKLVLWVLFLAGIAISISYFVGGSDGSLEVAGEFLPIPKFSSLFLCWNYFLVALVCLVTLVVVLKNFVDTSKVNKKKALFSLAVVVLFVGIIVACWFMGSPEKVEIVGYDGTDNEGLMARLSDACIYLTYILVVATFVALVWGRIHIAIKK